ncbi:conjugal transfer protein [Cohnella soli]|uniref:Conjugal transfer protein n=1 Tax=Cohnella soli TaxID=425005 RepID=A0ABW0HNZ4_9BACL
MRIRRLVSIVVYILLFFGCIAGLNVLTGGFRSDPETNIPDYHAMQMEAEHFSRLYLDWDKPLDQRQKEMGEIAPSVVPYLVSGKQSVEYVESGTPYFSGNRAYVDVTAITRIVAKVEEKEEEVSRRYKLTVFFVPAGGGEYVVERMPLQTILPATGDPRPVMDKMQETAASSIKPTLQVFLPALLSGDLRSVQTLLKPDSQIVAYKGEYEFLSIQDVRIREPSNVDLADYAVDIVMKVNDVQIGQETSLQVYLWVKQEGEKYYVVRANV